MHQNCVLELLGPILRPRLGNAPKSRSGSFLGPFCGLGLEMLQNDVLGASWAHSAAWAWKYSNMTFWELPGPILQLGLGNNPKSCSGSFLGSFCGLGLEMLQNGFLRGFLGLFCGLSLEMLQNGLLVASWAYAAAWA